jgi:hypothetical protein
MERVCIPNGEKRNAYKLLVGMPEVSLGGLRCRWVDYVIMYCRETGWLVWVDGQAGSRVTWLRKKMLLR